MAVRVRQLFGLSLENLPPVLPHLSSMHITVLYRALGEEVQPKPLPDLPVNRLLYHFFSSIRFLEIHGLGHYTSIPNFDLLPLSQGLVHVIKAYVTMLEDGVYVITLHNSPCPRIVVYCAEAAVLCCRLIDRGYEGLVLALFRHGIHFNTCVESATPPPPPPSDFIFPVVPPVVAADKEVDKAAYDGFVECRRLYLVGHRRRAALLRGGLVSRIARDVIGSDAECERLILLDPSPGVFALTDNAIVDWGDGTYLYDDVLADYELDYILGVHFHLKGELQTLFSFLYR
jgi:hypothetical protein